MSICICDQCGDPIDSDDDPDCFILVPPDGGDWIECESCRDHADMLDTQDSINAEMQAEFVAANQRHLR